MKKIFLPAIALAVGFTALVSGTVISASASTGSSSQCSTATTALLNNGAKWAWRFNETAPPSNWAATDLDDSTWNSGIAPFGFVADGVKTNIKTTGSPVVSYFRSTFTAPKLTGAESYVVNTFADDGLILYINGKEIGRSNMVAAPDAHNLYANSTMGGPVVFTVPAGLIKEGENKISSSVHLNYKGTRSVYFDANVVSLPTCPPVIVTPTVTGSPTTVPGPQVTGPTTTVPGPIVTGTTTTVPGPTVTGPTVTGSPTLVPGPTVTGAPTTVPGPTVTGPVVTVPPGTPGTLDGWGAPVWQDEFDSTAINSSKWNVRDKTKVGYDQSLINASQVTQANGELKILTEWLPTPVADTNRTRYFNTGYIDSIGKLSQRYGRWEIRAKLPLVQDASRGVWPAFWLRDSKGLGEIDIMEAIGAPHDKMSAQPQGSFSTTIHQSTNHEAGTTKVENINKATPTVIGGYHTWALEWTPQGMKFFYDGQLTWAPTTAQNPWFDTSFTDAGVNIRINTQVGEGWMGFADPTRPELTQLPASFDIDYVRVWKYNG